MANANDSTPSTSSAFSADSYIGSWLSLISKSDIRYEGILCHFDPQNSTLGLRNVRSYGTENRRKDGLQVPPGDKVYEYILFRGSDIKDLKVQSPPSTPAEEHIQNDPAIVQARCVAGPSTSFKLVSVGGGSLTECSNQTEISALNARHSPDVVPSKDTRNQSGIRSPQITQGSGVSPYGLQMQRHEYDGAAGAIPLSRQHLDLSTTIPYSRQNFLQPSLSLASSTSAVANLSEVISPTSSLAISSLASKQFSAPPIDSLSSLSLQSALPTHQSLPLKSNSLTTPSFLLTSQNVSSTGTPFVNNLAPDPVSLFPVQSLHSASFMNVIPDPSLKHPPQLLNPNQLSEPRLSEIPQVQRLYPEQMGMGISTPLNSSSMVATAAVQASFLPLSTAAQQSQYASNFTEEFDFEAMNQKFKKDEVWGYLGKANQRDQVEGTTSGQNGQKPGLVAKPDSKQPAYKRDDFFDTISCNSVARGARNGQNRFSERMRQDTEGGLLGHGGYGAGRGERRGLPNWGRGYNYGGRGYGGYPNSRYEFT